MTVDQNIKSNLIFLDDILKYLVTDSVDYTKSFDDLYKDMFGRELSEDNKINALGYYKSIYQDNAKSFEELFSQSIADNIKAQGEKLVEALLFLNNKQFIRLDVNFNVRITFEGIIQYSKTFLKEYKKQVKSELLNKWNILITIFIGMLGIIIGAIFNAC